MGEAVAGAFIALLGAVVGVWLMRGAPVAVPKLQSGKAVKPVEALKPAAVKGPDPEVERVKIIARAKNELGLSQSQAERFADEIIIKATATLGRLHPPR